MRTDADIIAAMLVELVRLKIRLSMALMVRDMADRILNWRGTEGFKITDPKLQDYVDACRTLDDTDPWNAGGPRAMKTLADRVRAVKAQLAEVIKDLPGTSSLIIDLDAIAHELDDANCPHGCGSRKSCRKCINEKWGGGL